MASEAKDENPEHINLKVMGQDGNVVQFKIKKHTALKKLMATYCERAGLALQVGLETSYLWRTSICTDMFIFRPSDSPSTGQELMRVTLQRV